MTRPAPPDWPKPDMAGLGRVRACTECGREVHARGLCSVHYLRAYRKEQTARAAARKHAQALSATG